MVRGKIRRGTGIGDAKGRNKTALSIAIVIDSVAVKAGIERVVTGLANMWVGLGYRVTIVTRDDRPSVFPLDPAVSRATLGMKSGFSSSRIIRYAQMIFRIISASFRLRKYFRRSRFDFIYSASPDNTFALYLAGLAHSNRIVASEHGAYAAYNVFWKTMKCFVYPNVYAVAAITESDAEKYRRMNHNTICFPNPLSFSSPKVSTLKSKTALAVGRLVSDKGYERMIDIWVKVSAERPGWKLRIIGDGPLKDRLNSLIREKKCEGRITIECSADDIRKEYLSASLYLMTSHGEGFGMVLVEAMECGLPCVAFDCPVGPGEIIVNGNGILVADGDDKAYEFAVKKLIDDSALRAKISAVGKSSVKRFHPERIAALWRDFYEK
jgi:glycosyltransferase involved in cell wall biosynthesis